MILVKRRKSLIPKVLLKGIGPEETKKAIAFFRVKANRGRKFNYKVYGHQTIRAALEKLFHGKCAYCESRYLATQPMDVEHWRPKGEVETEDGRKVKPGYYWLAATWENLLPSCIDCNRKRYQQVGILDGKPVLLGKKDSFPLRKGSPRATKSPQEKHEKPLLLNPCKDDGGKYFEFLLEKDANDDPRGIIRAKEGISPLKRAKAEKSIETYALSRVGLDIERGGYLIRIQAQIRRVKVAAQRIKHANTKTQQAEERGIYDEEVNLLFDYLEPRRPYILMARQIIQKEIPNWRNLLR